MIRVYSISIAELEYSSFDRPTKYNYISKRGQDMEHRGIKLSKRGQNAQEKNIQVVVRCRYKVQACQSLMALMDDQ